MSVAVVEEDMQAEERLKCLLRTCIYSLIPNLPPGAKIIGARSLADPSDPTGSQYQPQYNNFAPQVHTNQAQRHKTIPLHFEFSVTVKNYACAVIF